jgi:hypothetical protein
MAKKKIGIYGQLESTANNKVEDLYLIVDEQSICFSVKNTVSNEFVAFESFTNTNEHVGWNQLVAYLQNNSKLIQAIYGNIHFVMNSPRMILSKKQKISDLTIYLNELNIVHGERYEEELMISPAGPDAVLVYSVPDALQSLLSRVFPTGKWRHYASYLLAQKEASGLHIQLFENNYVLLIQKEGKIQLLQYQDISGDDMNVYTLLNACKSIGLNPNTLAVYITGYNELVHTWVNNLVSYFENAAIINAPETGIGASLNKEYPHHNYATYFIF